MAAPKQTDPQFKLRMTPEIKEQIETSAKSNNRSMNAEILARLTEIDDLRERLEAVSIELAAAKDPEVTKGIFMTAISALTKNGYMLRHTDTYTKEAEEWRYIRPFVAKRDRDVLDALNEGDLVRALSLARSKTPAGQEPPTLTTLIAQEDKSVKPRKE